MPVFSFPIYARGLRDFIDFLFDSMLVVEYTDHVFLLFNSFHMENNVSASVQDPVLASKFRVAEKNAIKDDQEFREYQAENVRACVNANIPIEVLDVEDSPMVAMAEDFFLYNY